MASYSLMGYISQALIKIMNHTVLGIKAFSDQAAFFIRVSITNKTKTLFLFTTTTDNLIQNADLLQQL